MASLVIILFFIEFIFFIYIFVYGVILNFLLLQNNEIIEKHFKELGYKIYLNDEGKKISRGRRVKVILEFISNNPKIKNKKFLQIILKKFNSLYLVFGLMIFIALILIFLIFYFF